MAETMNALVILLALTAVIPETVCKTRDTDNETKNYLNEGRLTNGVGISAWGLVFLILSLVLLGVGAYYVALFYPLICKKERKYNRIELTTV